MNMAPTNMPRFCVVATSPFATGTSSGSTVSGVAAQMIEGTKPPAMPARIMMPQ